MDQSIITFSNIEIENEIWKPLIDYEGYYEISNLGRIRKASTKRIRKISHTKLYSHILLSKNGQHKTRRIHRLVAETFLPKIKGKNDVNHINGNKNDNRVENLEWVTRRENNLHAYRVLKRKPSLLGHVPWNKKINQKDIPTMFQLNKRGITTDEIGKIFHLCGSTVRKHLRKYKKDNPNV